MTFLKRMFYWIATNIAIMLMISIIFGILKHFFNIDLVNYGESYTKLYVYCFAYGMIASLISLLLSKWSAKRLMHLEMIDEENCSHPKQAFLLKTVKNLSQKANIRMPEVGMYYSSDLNAFATGAFKNSSLIGVSTGLLDNMSEEEIEGVIAHEMTHIQNGDMITMTLLQGVLNSFVFFFSKIITNAIRERVNNGFITFFVEISLQIIFGILASPILAFFSRTREYKADFGASKLVGKHKMILALQKLKSVYEDEESSEMPKQLAAFGISEKKKKLSLFATHPSLDDRIKRLKESSSNELVS